MSIILFLQSFHGPAADLFFKAISFVAEDFIVLFIAYIYFFKDKKRGQNMAIIALSGLCFNSFLKNIFEVPRPYERSSEIIPLRKKRAGGYSFPSGHSQSTATMFFTLHLYEKRRVTLLLSITIPTIVGISRMYFGVHSPADILTGIFVGYLYAALIFIFVKRIKECDIKILWLLIFPFLSLLLAVFRDITPSALIDALISSGAASGFIIGAFLEGRLIAYTPPKSKKAAVIGTILSAFLLAGLYFFLSDLSGESPISTFLLYFVIGGYVSLGMPFIIQKTENLLNL